MAKSKLLRLFQYTLCFALIPLLSACGEESGEEGSELEINVEQESSNDTSAAYPVQTSETPEEQDADPTDSEPDGGKSAGVSPSRAQISTAEKSSRTVATNSASVSTTGEGTARNEPGERAEYDPALWDALLRKFVRSGRVNYSGFRDDRDFSTFVNSLESADPGSMSTDEALAFWINAYNALVVRNVLDHPGTKNPLDVKGFFDGIRFRVADRSLTLNGIENDVIRPTYNEPLIHFGLVCAALSCPPLIPKAYTGANVRSSLAENARDYLGNSRQNRFEESSGTLFLSKIFEWYKVDFGNSDAGVIEFVREHAPDELRERLNSADRVTVRYLEYDWTLNDL